MTERIAEKRQPRRLNRVLATAAGLALAAAGTGIAVNSRPASAEGGVTNFASPSPEAGAPAVAEEGFTLQSGQYMEVVPGDIISADGSMSDTVEDGLSGRLRTL